MTYRAPALLRYLRRLGDSAATADAALLGQYVSRGDGEAFAELVRRHGPMVWGVCRRRLGNEADAEAVFQATFLALARQAAALRRPEALAAWLHGVARRIALKARLAAARRGRHETRAVRPAPADPLAE